MHRQGWPTRRELTTAVFEYIEGWYNPHRRHSTLDYHSPADYETLQVALCAVRAPENTTTKIN